MGGGQGSATMAPPKKEMEDIRLIETVMRKIVHADFSV